MHAQTPDALELLGFAFVSYAAWRVSVTLGVLAIGVTLVLVANQMGDDNGDDGPAPGA